MSEYQYGQPTTPPNELSPLHVPTVDSGARRGSPADRDRARRRVRLLSATAGVGAVLSAGALTVGLTAGGSASTATTATSTATTGTTAATSSATGTTATTGATGTTGSATTGTTGTTGAATTQSSTTSSAPVATSGGS